MLRQLKYLLFRRPRLATKGNALHWSSYCDRQTVLEGKNKVGPQTTLIQTRLGFASYVGQKSTLLRAFVGRYSCIAPEVQTIIGRHPIDEFASIHPAFYSTHRQAGFTYVEQDLYQEYGTRLFNGTYLIEIGSDAWIGHGARILQGVRIGHGAVIAAGALVTKDVLPYTIVTGIPASPLRRRFSAEIAERLLRSEWWNMEPAQLKLLAKHFTSPENLLKAIDG